MVEYDNSGFTLTYCLLTTVTAIDIEKRKKSLAAWAECICNKYGVNPAFAHVDKDLSEIGALKTVWTQLKISLCWWHLRRAVHTQLGMATLATTPYNVQKACKEFDFVDADFIPPETRVDLADYEGGLPEEIELPDNQSKAKPLGSVENVLWIWLLPPSQSISMLPTNEQWNENINPMCLPQEEPLKICGTGFTLVLQPPSNPTVGGSDGVSEKDSNEKQTQ